MNSRGGLESTADVEMVDRLRSAFPTGKSRITHLNKPRPSRHHVLRERFQSLKVRPLQERGVCPGAKTIENEGKLEAMTCPHPRIGRGPVELIHENPSSRVCQGAGERYRGQAERVIAHQVHKPLRWGSVRSAPLDLGDSLRGVRSVDTFGQGLEGVRLG